MKNKNKFIEEIRLRLKAPAIALEKIAKGKYFPKVFAEAALSEIRKLQGLMKQN
jgi:hypothetical protein